MDFLHGLDITREFPAPEFPVDPIAGQFWKNGMVVRMPNWLGDAVMALPALYQLKQMLPPPCALAVICPVGLRPLFHALPWLDVILPLGDVHRNWTRGELRMVRRFAPGVGVLFNNSFRDVLMLRLARVGRLYGAAARSRGFLLRRSFPFPPRRDHQLNKLHHANKYLSIVYAMGAPRWDGVLPELKIPLPFQQMRPELKAVCDHPKLLVLAAGAAYGAAKRWKSESFRAVAAAWIARGGVAVTVGGASEHAIGEEIAEGLDGRKFFNLMGKTDLPELMHILRSARDIVANDSGVMHLAAALGAPGVAVFGSTDYSATGPIAPGWRIFHSGRKCSPCFKRTCPQGVSRCMADVTPGMVIEVLR